MSTLRGFAVHKAIVHSVDSVTGNCLVHIPALIGGATVSVPPTGLPSIGGDLLLPSPGDVRFVAVDNAGTPNHWVIGAEATAMAAAVETGGGTVDLTDIENAITALEGDFAGLGALAHLDTVGYPELASDFIDGAADVGVGLTDTDLIIVDNGGPTYGTTRKSALSRVATWLFAKMSGDVTTTSSGVVTIANDAVTNSQLANMANGTVKARSTAGTGNPEDVSYATLASALAPSYSLSGDVAGTLSATTITGLADTKLATISTANKVSASAIDIDGATDIGGALQDVDLFLVDDGAGGTNRKSALSRIATYLFGKMQAGPHVVSDLSGNLSIIAGAVTTTELDDDAVANSKAANMATQTIKGRNTAGTGDPEDLTVTQVANMLSHNSLSGLTTGDPHTQYGLVAGETWSGTHTHGGTDNFTGTKQVGGTAARMLVAVGTAACSSALTTGTSAADITGCTTGSLSLVSGDIVEIHGVFDAQHSTAAITMVGTLDINGVEQSAQALQKSDGAGDRDTVAQQWLYTVPSTASYTFKLRGRHSSGAPTGTFSNQHTTIMWKVYR